MAGFDYSRMQRTASRLMERFKQGAVKLARVTTDDPDPETPWLPGASSTVAYDLAATISAVTIDQATAKWVDGTTIVSSDLVLTCGVPAVVPKLSDYVTIDGVVQVIKKVIAIPAAGTPVAFKLIVGGGSGVPADVPTDLPMLDFSIAANSMYVPLLFEDF